VTLAREDREPVSRMLPGRERAPLDGSRGSAALEIPGGRQPLARQSLRCPGAGEWETPPREEVSEAAWLVGRS
jgi:hypothetical protein